ncbi:MAG: serine/threonine protein kinase [Actinobacteria bacterium]|nr:serine/threonine protein kinase [Actinomycetota bacterium]
MSSGPRSSPPDLPGFTPDHWIGGGGFADVFLYTQLRPSRSVAIKILRSEHLSPHALAQFDAEADIMAEVSTHPYIVTIFSSGVSPDGRPYIVMEHYPRPNFGERAKGGNLDIADVLRTGIQVAAAVETAHRAGIIHRDIKPANILTSAFDRPGLTDFGISGVQSETGISEAVGATPAYTAPELLNEESAGSVVTDVYGLAATISALAAGHSPFWSPDGDNGAQGILTRVLAGQRTRITRPGVPASFDNLIGQAMARDPRHRPTSALAFAQALQQIEQDLRLQPTPIEVAAAPAAPTRSTDDPEDGERTRRSIQVVDPQPAEPVRPTTPPGSPRGGFGAPAPAVTPPPASAPPAHPTGAPIVSAPGSTSAPSVPRVAVVTTTPSWARGGGMTDDAETVARARPGATPPGTFAPVTPTPVAPPGTPTGTPTAADPGAAAPAGSPYRASTPPLPVDADRPVLESTTHSTRSVRWKPIAAVAGVIVAVAVLALVLTMTTGRNSKAGPGSATTAGGPIQSIQTAAPLGPVTTPNDPTIEPFATTPTGMASTLTWTPDTDKTVSVTVDVAPMTGGGQPVSVEGPVNGKLPVTLNLGPDGSCTTASVGTRQIPCGSGPPCFRITGHAVNRATGTPVAAQLPSDNSGATGAPVLATPKLTVTPADYLQACASAFNGSGQ